MSTHSVSLLFGALAAVLVAASGCGSSSGDTTDHIGLPAHDTGNPLPPRSATVLVDTCVLDPWQIETLHDRATQHVVSEIIILCLVPQLDGTVGPRDPSAMAQLAATITDLHKYNYRVNLGVAFTDESGQRFDGDQTLTLIKDPVWRAQFLGTIGAAAAPADGIEIDIEKIPGISARDAVSELITELSPLIRPQKRLNIFVPPSVSEPSDLPTGDAFDLAVLAPLVDRMRVMTLDYSEGGPAGPTTDPGWAVDAVRLAKSHSANVDVAYPLYGIDFSQNGDRLTSWTEAMGIVSAQQLQISRSPTNTPSIHYISDDGLPHDLWWDDAESTADALGAWTYDVMPEDVGVMYYGLGSEDPQLFQALSSRLP